MDASRSPPFVARQRVALRQIRPSRDATSRGLILALPNIHGLDTDIQPLARRSLSDYEVRSVCLDLDRTRVAEGEVWIDSARHVADQILSSAISRPAALVGFSIGGYLGWLIDRMLVGAGQDPTPVVNLDGGVMHLHRQAWADLVRPLMPSGADVPAPRMLLAHSAAPGGLLLYDSSYADWDEIGVRVESLPYRTVNHPDFHRPAAIDAADGRMRTFVRDGGAPLADPANEVALDTVGGRIFEALAAPERPDVATVRPLAVSGLSVNANVMASLLFLSAATGDAAFALDVARRVRALAPRFKAAAYAETALRRAGAGGPPLPWGSLRGIAIGSVESLDFAAAFCRRSVH